MPIPKSKAFFGEVIFTSFPSTRIVAFVGIIEARKHIHQGRFPAAVLAQKSQNLALVYRQGDRVVGYHFAKNVL
jgi:hypothetical protein